jgi:hypothetical protein
MTRRLTGLRTGLAMLAFAASIATCLPLNSAIAQGHDNGRHDNGRRGNDVHDNGRGRGHEVHQYDWQREHWRNGYRDYGRGYTRRPDIYYSAPPVVVMPPQYYQAPPPPGLSLQFSLPLYN